MYFQCTTWKDVRDLFGCHSTPLHHKLESLCDNTTIDSGGNYGKSIVVFRGGKFWQFNNAPKKDKPFGDVEEGAVAAKRQWPGVAFPGGVCHDNNHMMIVYDKKWSKWAPSGEIEVDNEPFSDEESCPPTAVPLPNKRIAYVVKDDVI